MRRVFTVALALSLAAPISSAFAAEGAIGTASITGSVRGAAKAVKVVSVRLRNVANGQIADTTTVNAAGQFTFSGLEAGNYVVEVVNAAGTVVATSAPVALAAGATAAAAGLGAAGAAAGAAAGGAPFFGSLARMVVVAAAGAAVGGVTVAATQPDASVSR